MQENLKFANTRTENKKGSKISKIKIQKDLAFDLLHELSLDQKTYKQLAG